MPSLSLFLVPLIELDSPLGLTFAVLPLVISAANLYVGLSVRLAMERQKNWTHEKLAEHVKSYHSGAGVEK